METTLAQISDLTEDPENAREHPDGNLEAIKSSLEAFGQVEPLVVQASTGRVIGGNGRLRAMRELGWTEAAITVVDLDDQKARALGLALNRTAELAEWNFEQLEATIQALQAGGDIDVKSLGWSEDEIASLISSNPWEGVPTDEVDEGSPVENTSGTIFIKVYDKNKIAEVKASLGEWMEQWKGELEVT